MLVTRRDIIKCSDTRRTARDGWSASSVVPQRLGTNGGGIRAVVSRSDSNEMAAPAIYNNEALQATVFVGFPKTQQHEPAATDSSKPRLGHRPLQAGGAVDCEVSPAARRP